MGNYRVSALAMVGAFGLGALGMQALHAQSKAAAYVITEADVIDQDNYMKEYVPPVVKALESGGAKFLARGGKTVAVSGEPPKNRVSLSVYDSLEQAQAALASPAFLAARKIGDKYAHIRTFIVEGAAQ